MVRCARRADVAEKVCIITNGYYLTPELSDQLISAGLGELRVSLQGLDAETYAKNCGVRVNFDKLRRQLKYFYERRGDCALYIKIPGDLLKNAKDKEKFEEMFSGIADIVAVEHLIPNNNLHEGDGNKYTSMIRGGPIAEILVCSSLFMRVNVDVDGTLYACCLNDEGGYTGPKMGTLSGKYSLGEIWNHGTHLELCRNTLLHHPQDICASCQVYKYWISPKDYLDGRETEILKRYSVLDE
jgi:MoaA/NifB/PqqE/SkfB family radical SAM enzyme